jgi:hypothetical protein
LVSIPIIRQSLWASNGLVAKEENKHWQGNGLVLRFCAFQLPDRSR